jgi:hypothetical protein
MIFNKSILSSIVCSLVTIGAFSSIVSAETLITKNFKIKITRHCAEGNVSCDRVTYIGKDLNTGKSIRLNGKTVNSVNSYTFLGYEFRNGEYLYSVTRNNMLLVYKGDKLILREQANLIED